MSKANMKTVFGRLSSKNRVRIPGEVLLAMDIQVGDEIVFIYEGEKVTLAKAGGQQAHWNQAMEGALSEWNSQEDEEAYSDL